MFRSWNTIIIKNIATSALLLLLLSSCNFFSNKSSSKTNTINYFSVIEADTTVSLFASYLEPYCSIKSSFEAPAKASSKTTKMAAELFIISLVNEKYVQDNSTIEDLVDNYVKSFILNYLKEGKIAIANDEDAEELYWMNYEEKCNGKVLYNDNNILSYSVKTYSYSGGAHGVTSNNVASMNLATNKIYTLKQLFGEDNNEKLKALIKEKLSQNNQLFTEDIEVIQNFYLSNKGVSFVYSPLDIAAYSNEEITLTLDWNEISHLLIINPFQEKE